MEFSLKLARLAAILAIVAIPTMASTQFKLDPRYTDADGDMVADTPTAAKDWVDPATLVFAYTPAEYPAVYANVWRGFLDHLAKVTGKKVELSVSVDPELLGGVVARIGSTVYDGSVRTQLARMRQELVKQ